MTLRQSLPDSPAGLLTQRFTLAFCVSFYGART